jgi:lipooligosaccharide transport system permease protein
VTTTFAPTPASTSSPHRPLEGGGLIVLRNYVTYKSQWKLFATGFLEPVFYLFSIGIGVGKLIHAFELNGHSIPYAEFVAPGMLAASAFNGALLDSTFNVFFKLKYSKTRCWPRH